MRAIVRPLSLLALICAFVAMAQSEGEVYLGVNQLTFQTGSPSATTGGVDVAVTQKAAANFTCTRITIRVIDKATGMTIDTYIVNNPGESVSKSFTGIGGNKQVEVTVDAMFQSGAVFDPRHLGAVVTTR
jgi:hypothetical protein